MPEHPRSERRTLNRGIALFTDKGCADNLGYRHLGDWHELDKTHAFKQAMMQELLTGRTRLV